MGIRRAMSLRSAVVMIEMSSINAAASEAKPGSAVIIASAILMGDT
jgi:hypothetical protein